MKEGLVDIPNKAWFKIDEVCTITGVKEYILKFWEKEFDQINPDTNASYESLYSKDDVQTMLIIKDFLFNKKMTIDEAKLELNTCHLDLEPASELVHEDVVEEDQVTDERLVELSSKLSQIISFTESIQSRHNWN